DRAAPRNSRAAARCELGRAGACAAGRIRCRGDAPAARIWRVGEVETAVRPGLALVALAPGLRLAKAGAQKMEFARRLPEPVARRGIGRGPGTAERMQNA